MKSTTTPELQPQTSDTAAQHQAYSQALQSKGLLPEAAERAADILQQPSRTREEQAFISECWLLMQTAPAAETAASL